MPKIKKGLEYFSLHTDLNNDMRIKLLRAEFGIKGFGIWVQLLLQIYADEGYYLEWDNDTKLLFANDVGVSGGLVDEVINRVVKRGLFNEDIFTQFSVLTSLHIQEQYFSAIKRRTSDIEVDPRFLLISRNSDIIKGNVNIKVLNVDRKKQSRGEESKHRDTPRERPREAEFSDPYRLNVPVPEQIRSDPDWISVIEKWLSHLKEKNCFPTSYQQEAIVQEQASIGKQRSIASILHSIKNGWKSIHEPKPDKNGDYKQSYRRGYKPTQGDRQIEQLKTF